MKKSLKINLNLSNRAIYTLIAFTVFILAGVSVFAYGTSSPSTFGHSASEIDGVCLSGGTNCNGICLTDGTGCPTGSGSTPSLQAVTDRGSTTSRTISAARFYDVNDQSYYLYPSSTSKLDQISLFFLTATAGIRVGALGIILESPGSDGPGIDFRSAGNAAWHIDNNAGRFRIFGGSPLTELFNMWNGKVGIGVAFPTQKLDVQGKVKATGFCIGNNCITSWGCAQAPGCTGVCQVSVCTSSGGSTCVYTSSCG